MIDYDTLAAPAPAVNGGAGAPDPAPPAPAARIAAGFFKPRLQRFQPEAGEYAHFWADLQMNLSDAQTRAFASERTATRMLLAVLRAWNAPAEDGGTAPITEETVAEIPIELREWLLAQWNERYLNPLAPTNAPSSAPSSPTSTATSPAAAPTTPPA